MRTKLKRIKRLFPFRWKDLGIFIGIMFLAVGSCALLQLLAVRDGFASPIIVLAVLLISRLTTGYLFGVLAALLGVVAANMFFTFPYGILTFDVAGYPLNSLTLFTASLITCSLTRRATQREELRMENERERMRADLLRAVSHDIRTPLTSIAGSTSALLETPGISETESRELLKDVRDEANWLIRVVENLLSITRIGEDPTMLKKSEEAVEEVLGDVVQKFRKLNPEVKINVRVPDELLLVPMDPILIEQVVYNLLENAVRHGGATRLEVTAEAEPGQARFHVRDNGKGIRPEELPTLFSGYLRKTPTTGADGKRNMGLGLSVCMAVVKAHGGNMLAENYGEGAELQFVLPMDAPSAENTV